MSEQDKPIFLEPDYKFQMKLLVNGIMVLMIVLGITAILAVLKDWTKWFLYISIWIVDILLIVLQIRMNIKDRQVIKEGETR